MTKIILETDSDWTIKKIKSAINTEAELLRKAILRSRIKLDNFEMKYGKLNRDTLYLFANEENHARISSKFALQVLGEVLTLVQSTH